ncbi:S1 family peptidase [Streptomyces fuscigenes]|nr:trypsin-like serine protease [Streptomyces fuscigenes]MCF3963569.1 S1 family peptidase [Streptomyces fuscigenes]
MRFGAAATALAAASIALGTAPASAVTGDPVAGTTYSYSAQVVVGDHDRGCSAALVDPEWLLTAASCFADDPAASLAVPAGKPKLHTTATIGRTDLSGTAGAVRDVVQLVPRTDRDVVLARLNRPVTNVAPVALAGSAPSAGEKLQFAGYGRTKTEWAPLALHSGTLSVDAAAATTAAVTGQDGAAACMGDTGGPVVRTTGAGPELAALTSQSYQGGCFGIDPAETRTGGVVARVDDLGSWVTSTVGASRITDFNCDGTEDVAVADPKATVGGVTGAGLVRIVYGGGKGTDEINQDLDWVPGAGEKDDWFGEAIATVDYNEDGCTDLVVGTPSEDLGGAADAGMVDILYGAPAGLGTGTVKNAHFEQGSGTGSIKAGTSEAGDRMGQALAAGTTAAGDPYLVIGVPGESVGTVAGAGDVYYVHDGTSVAIDQDTPGVPGGVEAGDAFGSAIAADANHIAVSAPHDAIGTDVDAGNLQVFDQKLTSDGFPTPLFGLDQDDDAVSGASEPGDLFGASLAMVPYRTSSEAAATDSVLVAGSPGEDLTIDGVNKADAGMVNTFDLTAAGSFTQLNWYSQGPGDDDVSGTSEAGDHFGQNVAAVNTAPREVGTADTLKMAVGSPDEAIGTTVSAGAISTFSLLGTPGAHDKWIESGDGDGIPGASAAKQYLGVSLHYTGTALQVGMPYGPSTYGAVYSLPMSNVTAGGATAAVTAYEPGKGGLPAAGERFGYVVR